MGLASQDTPFNFPHSVAQYTNQVPKRNAQDQMGRVDGYNPQSGRKEAAFTWTDIYEKEPTSSLPLGSSTNEVVTNESVDQHEGTNSEELISSKPKFRQFICGEEALKISPTEPYCLQRPVRRGHLNISQHYPMQQLLEDLHAIWDCILIEKLHIPHIERNMYSAILVMPETFDNRGLTSRVHH